jgi:type II secretory pathway component PulJ
MTLERILIMGFIGLVALMLMPLISLVLYRLMHESKRRRRIVAIAASHGVEFKDAAVGMIKRLSHFRLFAGGTCDPRDHARIRNVVVSKIEDKTVTIFDYQWRGHGSGEDIDPRERRTVVHVASSHLNLPRFEVRPNGPFLKLTSRFRNKVAVGDHAEFAGRYDITSDEADSVRAAFNSEVMDHIARDAGQFQFEGKGGEFIIYSNAQKISLWSFCLALLGEMGDGRVEPDAIPRLIQFGDALCDHFLTAQSTAYDKPAVAGV